MGGNMHPVLNMDRLVSLFRILRKRTNMSSIERSKIHNSSLNIEFVPYLETCQKLKY